MHTRGCVSLQLQSSRAGRGSATSSWYHPHQPWDVGAGTASCSPEHHSVGFSFSSMFFCGFFLFLHPSEGKAEMLLAVAEYWLDYGACGYSLYLFFFKYIFVWCFASICLRFLCLSNGRKEPILPNSVQENVITLLGPFVSSCARGTPSFLLLLLGEPKAVAGN